MRSNRDTIDTFAGGTNTRRSDLGWRGTLPDSLNVLADERALVRRPPQRSAGVTSGERGVHITGAQTIFFAAEGVAVSYPGGTRLCTYQIPPWAGDELLVGPSEVVAAEMLGETPVCIVKHALPIGDPYWEYYFQLHVFDADWAAGNKVSYVNDFMTPCGWYPLPTHISGSREVGQAPPRAYVPRLVVAGNKLGISQPDGDWQFSAVGNARKWDQRTFEQILEEGEIYRFWIGSEAQESGGLELQVPEVNGADMNPLLSVEQRYTWWVLELLDPATGVWEVLEEEVWANSYINADSWQHTLDAPLRIKIRVYNGKASRWGRLRLVAGAPEATIASGIAYDFVADQLRLYPKTLTYDDPIPTALAPITNTLFTQLAYQVRYADTSLSKDVGTAQAWAGMWRIGTATSEQTQLIFPWYSVITESLIDGDVAVGLLTGINYDLVIDSTGKLKQGWFVLRFAQDDKSVVDMAAGATFFNVSGKVQCDVTFTHKAGVRYRVQLCFWPSRPISADGTAWKAEAATAGNAIDPLGIALANRLAGSPEPYAARLGDVLIQMRIDEAVKARKAAMEAASEGFLVYAAGHAISNGTMIVQGKTVSYAGSVLAAPLSGERELAVSVEPETATITVHWVDTSVPTYWFGYLRRYLVRRSRVTFAGTARVFDLSTPHSTEKLWRYPYEADGATPWFEAWQRQAIESDASAEAVLINVSWNNPNGGAAIAGIALGSRVAFVYAHALVLYNLGAAASDVRYLDRRELGSAGPVCEAFGSVVCWTSRGFAAFSLAGANLDSLSEELIGDPMEGFWDVCTAIAWWPHLSCLVAMVRAKGSVGPELAVFQFNRRNRISAWWRWQIHGLDFTVGSDRDMAAQGARLYWHDATHRLWYLDAQDNEYKDETDGEQPYLSMALTPFIANDPTVEKMYDDLFVDSVGESSVTAGVLPWQGATTQTPILVDALPRNYGFAPLALQAAGYAVQLRLESRDVQGWRLHRIEVKCRVMNR